MPEALQIVENLDIPSRLDFAELRRKGLQHISNLSGDLWTDHNVHDPGITMLEVLCYALTDLAYRTDFNIKELLARPDRDIRKNILDDNFFTPAEILSCNPLTILDYRKLLIDIDGVRNAWLETADESEVQLYINCKESELQRTQDEEENLIPLQINGLYHVCLELESIRPQDQSLGKCAEDDTSRILEEAQARLHAHRNLGEDFLDIIVLKKQKIGLCSDIELKPDADQDEVLTRILEAVQLFFSPTINSYSLQALLEKGKSMEEAFEGRPLITSNSHGFLDTDELEELERWTEIRVSDLYRVISALEGVEGIKNLALVSEAPKSNKLIVEPWCLILKDLHCPLVSLENSTIRFFKGILPFEANEEKAQLQFQERLSNYRKVILSPKQLDAQIPNGTFREDLGDYYSIQHDFPLVYGIGEDGLSKNAPLARKAQALQLQAYLLFYDQLLSNYLVQLSNLRSLFAIRAEEEVNQSYFIGSLDSVPRIDQLTHFHKTANVKLKTQIAHQTSNYKTSEQRDAIIRQWIRAFEIDKIDTKSKQIGNCFHFEYYNQLTQTSLISQDYYATPEKAIAVAKTFEFLGTQANAYRKVNQQLSGNYSFDFIYNPVGYEDFIYELLEDKSTYYERKNKILDHLLARFAEQFTDYVLLTYALEGKDNDPEKVIQDKANFLRAYPEISRNRGKAIDYQQSEVWETDNIAGLTRRVTHLMGQSDWNRSSMGNFELVNRDQEIYEYVLHDRKPCGSIKTTCCQDEEECDSALSNPILKSLKSYQNAFGEDSAEQAFEDIFLPYAKQKKHYRTFDCEEEQTFGFHIVDEKGFAIATHPVPYSSAAHRDEALRCVQNWLHGTSSIDGIIAEEELSTGLHSGWMTNIASSEAGYYFWLKDDDEKNILKSVVHENELETWEAWLRFIEAIKNEENFQDTTDIHLKYSFELIDPDSQLVIAIHPERYDDIEVRDKVKTDAINYLSERGLCYQNSQKPSTFQWQYRNEGEEILLESNHYFRHEEQALGNFYTALQSSYFRKSQSADGKYYFEWINQVQEGEVVVLAHSKNFDSQEECDDLQDAILASITEILIENQTAHRYLLQDQNDEILLFSTHLFKDISTAFWNARNQLSSNCKLKVEQVEGYCLWEVNLYTENSCLIAKAYSVEDPLCDEADFDASKSHFPTKKAAEAAKKEILSAAKDLQTNIRNTATTTAFQFELKVDEEYSIVSAQLYTGTGEALFAHRQLLNKLQEENNYLPIEIGGQKQLAIFDDCGNLLAFFDDCKIDDLIESIENQCFSLFASEKSASFCFTLWSKDESKIWLAGEEAFESELKASIGSYRLIQYLCNEEDSIKKTKQEDGCWFGFQVEKEEYLLAVHPVFYETEALRDAAIEQMKSEIEACKFNFRLDKINGKFHYEIQWFNCAGICETLLEGEKQDSIENAQNALQAFQEKITAAAVDCEALSEALKLKESTDEKGNTSYSFEMKLSGLSVKHPFSYASEAEVKKVMQLASEYFHAYQCHHNASYNLDYCIQENDCVQSDPCEIEKDQASYRSFRLKKNHYSIARLIKKYQTAEERDQVIEDTICKIKEGKISYSDFVVNTRRVGRKFYFEILENNKRGLCWQSVKNFDSELVALDKATQNNYAYDLLNLAKNAANYRTRTNEEGEYELSLWQEDEMVLKAPKAFIDEGTLEQAKKAYIKFARSYPIVQKGKEWSFQLTDENHQNITWESTATYSNPKEAWKNFRAFWSLLQYRANYQKIDNEQACLFQLKLGEVLLEGKKIYEGRTELCPLVGYADVESLEEVEDLKEEIKEFRAAVKEENCKKVFDGSIYKVVSKKEENRFDVYLQANNKTLLIYHEQFSEQPNDKEIERIQKEFCNADKDLRLIPLKCECKIRVELRSKKKENNNLERQKKAIADNANLEEDSPGSRATNLVETATWDALNEFLEQVQTKGSVELIIDYQNPCQYSFQFVSKDYYLAQSEQQYYTQAEASKLRDWLFKKANCSTDFYTLAHEGTCNTEGHYHFLIFDGCNSESRQLIWKSTERFWDNPKADPEEENAKQKAEKAYTDGHLEILHYATFEDCYKTIERVLGGEKCFELHLVDETGKVIAKAATENEDTEVQQVALFKTEEEKNAAIVARIRHARHYPFFKNSKGRYEFQLYCKEAITVELPFETAKNKSFLKEINIDAGRIWRSSLTYSTLKKAQDAFCNTFLPALRLKSNYHLQGKNDCGPFTVTLTNPAELYATHPNSYASVEARNEALEKVQHCMNMEGFHVLEHILLRPKINAKERYFITGTITCEEREIIERAEVENEIRICEKVLKFASLQSYRSKKEAIDARAAFWKTAKDQIVKEVIKENESYRFVTKSKEGEKVNVFITDTAIFKTESANKIVDQLKSIELCVEANGEEGIEEKLLPICVEESCCAEEIATKGECCKDENEETTNVEDRFIPNTDPYSFWATVVLPYWSRRFQNTQFRSFFEETLRKETPAHVALSIAWISPEQMRAFETAYQSWLEALNGSGKCEYVEAKNDLIDILNELENVYPPIRLSEGVTDDETTPTILDNAVLR